MTDHKIINSHKECAVKQYILPYFNITLAKIIKNSMCVETRDTLRDRRPSTAASPACWAMETKKLKKCMVRK